MSPTEVAITEARHELTFLHQELVRNGLVAWTAGNVSSVPVVSAASVATFGSVHTPRIFVLPHPVTP